MKLRDLPLVSLRTFAVVAESRSVTAAAETLGVTHSAVSKQVKLLERWLGQTLFMLEGRRLVLTPYGEMLSDRLGIALEDIASSCAYVQRQRGRRTITVEAPATFAMCWLLPRIPSFRQLAPQTDVWVSTRMTGQTPNFSGHDLVVVRGDTAPPTSRLNERVLLFCEQMTVMSSPRLLASSPLSTPTDLKHHQLIESVTRPHDWHKWLKLAGVKDAVVGGGHRFDHLFVAVQAVKDGLGSSVAPLNLLQTAIENNELACPFPELSFSGQPYFAYSADSGLDDGMRSFKDWLSREAGSQTYSYLSAQTLPQPTTRSPMG